MANVYDEVSEFGEDLEKNSLSQKEFKKNLSFMKTLVDN